MQLTYKIENLIKELTETVNSEKAGIAIFITDKEQVCGSVSCDALDLIDFMALSLKKVEECTGLKPKFIYKAMRERKGNISNGE